MERSAALHELVQLSGLPATTIQRLLRYREFENLLSTLGTTVPVTEYDYHEELTAFATQQWVRTLQEAGYELSHHYDPFLRELLVCARARTRTASWNAWLPTPVGFTNFLEHTGSALEAHGRPSVGYAAGDRVLEGSGGRSEEWIGPVRVCRANYSVGGASLQQQTTYLVCTR